MFHVEHLDADVHNVYFVFEQYCHDEELQQNASCHGYLGPLASKDIHLHYQSNKYPCLFGLKCSSCHSS